MMPGELNISEQIDHPFRSKSITPFGVNRSVLSEQIGISQRTFCFDDFAIRVVEHPQMRRAS